MEILFVSHKYPPATGGMEKQSFELIQGLGQLTKIHTIVYEGEGSRIRFFLTLNKRIRQTLREHPETNIIHFNDGLIAAVSLLHRGYRHLKRTATLHGLDVVFPSFIYQRFIFPLFNRFDLLIAVSRATAHACKVRGIDEKKVVVVNNGVDPKLASGSTKTAVLQLLNRKYNIDAHNKRILVAMGRPVRRKGFSWFIKNVMPKIPPDFMLLLIGPVQDRPSKLTRFLSLMPAFLKHRTELFLAHPGDEHAINTLIKKHAAEGNVFRLGKLPLEEVVDIISTADAFIMPNIEVEGDMEGFGLVCLEAAMCGTKVFASSSGGITDAVIPNANGTLLPPGHIASWISVLSQLNNPAQKQTADGKSIISFTAERFNWQKMSQEYLEHFSTL